MALAPQSDHGSAACAETVAFFQYGPPQSFFKLTWLALQKARVREVAQRLMTTNFSAPPLLWLAPQSDHGSAACAETKAFLQYGPPQSFAEPGSPYKKNVRGKLAQGLMTGRKVLSPPLLALAPQSDHGSAARAETEAFFPYGPPQSFFELSWLAGKLAQGLMTGRKVLSPSWLAPQSDHGSAACAETEAFFQYGPPQSFFRVKLACPTKSTRAGSWRNNDDRAQISKPPPSYGSLRNPITGVPHARKLKLFSNLARRNPFSS